MSPAELVSLALGFVAGLWCAQTDATRRALRHGWKRDR